MENTGFLSGDKNNQGLNKTNNPAENPTEESTNVGEGAASELLKELDDKQKDNGLNKQDEKIEENGVKGAVKAKEVVKKGRFNIGNVLLGLGIGTGVFFVGKEGFAAYNSNQENSDNKDKITNTVQAKGSQDKLQVALADTVQQGPVHEIEKEEFERLGSELHSIAIGSGVLTKLININNYYNNPNLFEELDDEIKRQMLIAAYRQIHTTLNEFRTMEAERKKEGLESPSTAIVKMRDLGMNLEEANMEQFKILLDEAMRILLEVYDITIKQTDAAYIGKTQEPKQEEKTSSVNEKIESVNGLSEKKKSQYKKSNDDLIGQGFEDGKVDMNYVNSLSLDIIEEYLVALQWDIEHGSRDKNEVEMLSLLKGKLDTAKKEQIEEKAKEKAKRTKASKDGGLGDLDMD